MRYSPILSRLSPEWENRLNIKISYSCFHRVACLNIRQLMILARNRWLRQANQFLAIITDVHSNLSCAVMKRNISSSRVAHNFLNRSIVAWKFQKITSLITSNISSEKFSYFCIIILRWNVATFAYHPQTNGQIDRNNRTLLSWLWLYIADKQRNWHLLNHPLAYNFSFQTRRVINGSSFYWSLHYRHLVQW